MQMEQHLAQAQKLMLTQTMQQSLQCLQMPMLELREFLQEAALTNPLLEVEEIPLGDLHPETVELPSIPEGLSIERREQIIWESSGDGAMDPLVSISRPQSFQEYLNDQLGQHAALSRDALLVCRYLVGCLSSAGYLDCSLPELADELRLPLFDLEQALYIVQSLDPPGVGARSLSECLLLQLAQGHAFTEVNLHLVRSGLPLLAQKDYPGLAKLLGVRQPEARRAAETIRGLNPIPSRGFYSGGGVSYTLPEATIRRDHDEVVIEMNSRQLPRVTLNADYCGMLGSGDCPDAQAYLREKAAEARGLIASVENRGETMVRLLSAVVRVQPDYFLHRGELQPMTMKQIAETLELNISTVSRAVKDKYIQFDGQTIPLRGLFTASLQTTSGQSASSDAARRQLQRFIAAEDSAKPLSDEALCGALAGAGILLSRRTVAKYRGELNIPAAGGRKKEPR